MHTKLLQEVHDQSSISHFENKWIIDLVQRFYYWSNHQATIWWYIWNCHACQRSKVSKDSINELHHSLLISQKRWKDIAMNFITELSLSEDYNIICTVICCLIKERHYILCHWCYDSSYAFMLIAMLMTMLMTIVDRSSLNYKVVSRSTLFKVSLCSSESYR